MARYRARQTSPFSERSIARKPDTLPTLNNAELLLYPVPFALTPGRWGNAVFFRESAEWKLQGFTILAWGTVLLAAITILGFVVGGLGLLAKAGGRLFLLILIFPAIATYLLRQRHSHILRARRLVLDPESGVARYQRVNPKDIMTKEAVFPLAECQVRLHPISLSSRLRSKPARAWGVVFHAGPHRMLLACDVKRESIETYTAGLPKWLVLQEAAESEEIALEGEQRLF